MKPVEGLFYFYGKILPARLSRLLISLKTEGALKGQLRKRDGDKMKTIEEFRKIAGDIKIIDKDENVLRAKVKSANTLSQKTLEELGENLKKKYKAKG